VLIPATIDEYVSRAQTRWALGDRAGAEADCRVARTLPLRNSRSALLLADLLMRLGQGAEALEVVGQAIAQCGQAPGVDERGLALPIGELLRLRGYRAALLRTLHRAAEAAEDETAVRDLESRGGG
jgi:hypothetical protein